MSRVDTSAVYCMGFPKQAFKLAAKLDQSFFCPKCTKLKQSDCISDLQQSVAHAVETNFNNCFQRYHLITIEFPAKHLLDLLFPAITHKLTNFRFTTFPKNLTLFFSASLNLHRVPNQRPMTYDLCSKAYV